MKTPIRILKTAALALAAVLLTSAARAVTIDPAKAAIVSGLSAKNETMADFLLHMELITGVKIPLVRTLEQAPAGAFPIYVGTAPADQAAGVKDLKPEEARFRVTDKGIWIWGHALHGTDHATYAFLEEALGCTWPWSKKIAYFKQNPLKVAERDYAWYPTLKVRRMRSPAGIWRARLRDGGHDAPTYGHAFSDYWGKYGQTQIHPDWFGMRADGKRMPVGFSDETALNPAASKEKPARFIAMCVSNDEYVDHVVKEWADKGAGEYINLCENDAAGEDSCHCPKCEALDMPKPADGKDWWVNWKSDRYINFAKRVLAKARKIRPDVKVVQYAYNAMELPPRREKMDDSIVMGMVPVHFTKKAITDYVTSWTKAGLKEFFHRPNRRCYYGQGKLPMGYDRHFFDIFKINVDNGAIGFMYENGPDDPMDGFADYLIEKGMQEPDKPFEHWENLYFKGFGPAAEDVKAFFRYWREEVWEKRLEPDMEEIAELGKYFNFTRGLYFSIGKYYTPEDFKKANAHLEKALARTDLEPQTRALIEELRTYAEGAELFANAVGQQTEQAAKALVDWRDAHKRGSVESDENHFGDICGVKRFLDRPPANYRVGRKCDWTKKIAIVNWNGEYPEETAELKKVLEFLVGHEIPVFKSEKDMKFVTPSAKWTVPEYYSFYVGRVPFNQTFADVQFMKEEEGYFKATMYEGVFFWGKKKGVRNGIRKFLEHEWCCRWPWEDEFALHQKSENAIYIYTRRAFNWEPPFQYPIVERKVVRDEGLPLGLEEKLFAEWKAALKDGKPFKVTFDGKMSVYDWYLQRMIDYACWDPDKPFEYWEPRYMQAFGTAGGEMREYYRFWRTALKAGAVKPTKAMFAEAGKILDRALAHDDFRGNDKARVERVRREHDAAAAKCK